MKRQIQFQQPLLILAALFLFHQLPCQEEFLPAHVFTLSGDTLRGFIDYKNWGRNPSQVSFKETSGAAVSVFTPLKIKGFGVADEIYLSDIVEAEDSPTVIDNIPGDPKIKIRFDTAFIQALVCGPKNLYLYRDTDGKDHFYILRDSLIELLVYKKYLKKELDKSRVVENKKYIGQLALYFKDCPSIIQELQKCQYTKKSLTKIFDSYYKATLSAPDFQRENEKTILEWGLVSGASLTSYKLIFGPFRTVSKNTPPTIVIQAEYPHAVNYSGGAYLNIVLPRNKQQWSLYNELRFHPMNVKSTVVVLTDSLRLTYYPESRVSYVSMYNLVRYRSPLGSGFIFVQGGFGLGFPVDYPNYWWYEKKVIYGMGGTYKRFSLDLRVERARGLVFFGLLGYRF